METDPLRDALQKIAELEKSSLSYQQAADAARQELQHFVYAASHDLQEPLRTVTSYTQLLERRYGTDDEARELTSFVTTGIARMNELLHNLVIYSRVNASSARSQMSLSGAVQVALYNLAQQMKETGGKVEYADLPDVRANEVQMGILFEHLLRNSLLFKAADAPEILISYRPLDDGHQVSFRDNGIGIDPQFLDHVLLPFKRLHGKEVPGNGLGLAICDKIVKAHGGRIWLESDGAKGTTAHFTIAY